MPAAPLLEMVNDDLVVEQQWMVNGVHYAKTLRAWLKKLDENTGLAMAIFRKQETDEEARRQVGRWRIFFMACEELFGYGEGEEWYVSHYLLKKR